MLSDQERRMLEELEVSFAGDAVEPDRSGRSPRRMRPRPPTGALSDSARAVAVALLVGLVLTGAATAAFALGLAGALGWGSWRAWPRLVGSQRSARPVSPRVRGARRPRRTGSTWLRRHLERLVEEE